MSEVIAMRRPGLSFEVAPPRAVHPNRTDIANWFDLLDVDDFASYGGKP